MQQVRFIGEAPKLVHPFDRPLILRGIEASIALVANPERIDDRRVEVDDKIIEIVAR